MNPYFDTGVILKVYVPEKDSKTVITIIRSYAPPLLLSHLLELELRTAIRLKNGRNEISRLEMQSALSQFDADIRNKIFTHPSYDMKEVFFRAEQLSSKFASITKARTADIWHVAAAQVLGCRELVSFDSRQRELAKLSGLKILPHSIPD